MEPTKICFYCEKNVDVVCKKCNLIGACNLHESFHLSEKGKCFPIRVLQKKGVGRCIVALKDIKPGKLLLEDYPVVFGPKSIYVEEICVECLSLCRQSYCVGCRIPKCQKCKSSGDEEFHTDDECKMVKLFLKNSGSEEWTEELLAWLFKSLAPLRLFIAKTQDDSIKERLDFLMDHLADREEDEASEERTISEIVCAILSTNRSLLKAYSNQQELTSDIDRCVGLLRTNALDGTGGKGRILLPTFSFLSHSCVNNAKHVLSVNGDSIRLYSQTLIKANEEVTITYTNLLRGTSERRARLQYQWHFKCQCQRCQDPTELGTYIGALKCPHCREGILCLDPESETWSCEKCGQNVKNTDAENLVFTLHQMLKEIQPNRDNISAFKKFLETTDPLLHDNHFLRIVAKRFLSQLYDAVENAAKKCKVSNNILEIFEKLDPGLSLSRGLTLIELADSEIHLKEKSQPDIEVMILDALECLQPEMEDSLPGMARDRAFKMLNLINGFK